MLKGKKEGSMMKMLPVLLSVVTLAMLSIIYLNNMQTMELKERTEQMAREYILRMETKGYLSEEEKNIMILELQEWGCKNISLSGSTFINAGYGNPVQLCINLSIPHTNIILDNLFDIERENEFLDIKILKRTIAKN